MKITIEVIKIGERFSWTVEISVDGRNFETRASRTATTYLDAYECAKQYVAGFMTVVEEFKR